MIHFSTSLFYRENFITKTSQKVRLYGVNRRTFRKITSNYESLKGTLSSFKNRMKNLVFMCTLSCLVITFEEKTKKIIHFIKTRMLKNLSVVIKFSNEKISSRPNVSCYCVELNRAQHDT